ncbi:MAG: NUDIX domain-containing protein, partial [Rhabdochlamydiaceae bacterium]
VAREVNEETGLAIKEVVKYFGHFDYLSESGKKSRQFNFMVLAEEDKDARLDPKEHSEFAWVTKNESQNYNITEEVRKVIENAWF